MKRDEKHKRRFLLVVSSITILIYSAWSFAIKPTIELNNEITELKQAQLSLKDAPSRISQLKQESIALDKIIGNATTGINETFLVNQISGYIQKNMFPELYNIPPVHTTSNEKYIIKTYTVELQGDFNSLVKTLYHFERERSFGNFTSAQFKLSRDIRTKKNYLRLKLYIQTYTENLQ